MAYKSLTFAAVPTVPVDLQRRHLLSLGPPSRMVLRGPWCLYTDLSIAGFGWKVRFSGCGDYKLDTRAERVRAIQCNGMQDAYDTGDIHAQE